MANSTSGICPYPDLTNTRGAAPTAGTPTLLLQTILAIPHVSFSGSYRIAGSTVDGGTPVKRRVYLFAQPSMLLVRSATTELPAGAFEFTGLAAGQYVVMGFDPDGVQNAVTYSHVSSVP